MDVEILARIQFAFTIAFHYIYPPLSIGLGLLLVIMEGMYLATGNKGFNNHQRFFAIQYFRSNALTKIMCSCRPR